jgi:protein-L-isoaspartate(D-aspartate) O-methyltransferase
VSLYLDNTGKGKQQFSEIGDSLNGFVLYIENSGPLNEIFEPIGQQKPLKRKNFEEDRERMVRVQLEARGIKDKGVLEAMTKVPRHMFVPENMLAYSYHDEPLPIGEGQTISQPYIVAYMTEALELKRTDHVLEIGTGSGYQSAVLAELAGEVYSVELNRALSLRAQEILKDLAYTNIYFKVGDGTYGWVEQAPFDAIMVTAAPDRVPRALEEQLKVGGRMILPVGSAVQELILVIRGKKKFKRIKLLPVRFVPLISTH